MRFANPVALWLLLLLPGLVYLLDLGRRRQAAWLRLFGDRGLLKQTPARFPALRRAWVSTCLLLLVCASLLLALGDPRLPYGAPRLQADALDVVLVFDVSKSMAAEDYGVRSRLAQAREVARHLLPELQGNRVGLVTFAGTSFPQASLTYDLQALDFIIQYWVSVNTIGVGGSDITAAIQASCALFPDTPGREQLVLLFSDGGDASETLPVVLSQARKRGIRIVTVGVGQREPSAIPLYDAQQTFTGYLTSGGQVLTTQLHEAPLQQIAAATNGAYVHLVGGGEWRHLLGQRPVVGDTLRHDELKLFQPFLGLGLLAFATHLLVMRL